MSRDRNAKGGDRALRDEEESVCVCGAATPPAKTIFLRSLTVTHFQVPSDQSDFPVLVSIIDPTLKTVANGGHVAGSNGFDIIFYADASATIRLKWQVELYVPITGRLIAWVKVPLISSSADTLFYIRYGDSSIITDQSDPVNVWTNNFLAVYHLGDGITLDLNDSTGSFNGANSGVTAVAGLIYGAGNFVSASNNHIDLGTGFKPQAITQSAWVNAASFPNSLQNIISQDAGGRVSEVMVNNNGKLSITVTATGGAVGYNGTGTFTLSTSTWYYIVMTYVTGLGLNGYVNASLDGHVNDKGGLNPGTANTWIGGDISAPGRYWNGIIDEPRVASVARSADWVTAEYNNQKAGATFLTVGPET